MKKILRALFLVVLLFASVKGFFFLTEEVLGEVDGVPSLPNVTDVCPSGCDHTDLQTALDSQTACTANNPCTIHVRADLLTLPSGGVTLNANDSYTHIIGDAGGGYYYTTQLRASGIGASGITINGAVDVSFSNLTISEDCDPACIAITGTTTDEIYFRNVGISVNDCNTAWMTISGDTVAPYVRVYVTDGKIYANVGGCTNSGISITGGARVRVMDMEMVNAQVAGLQGQDWPGLSGDLISVNYASPIVGSELIVSGCGLSFDCTASAYNCNYGASTFLNIANNAPDTMLIADTHIIGSITGDATYPVNTTIINHAGAGNLDIVDTHVNLTLSGEEVANTAILRTNNASAIINASDSEFIATHSSCGASCNFVDLLNTSGTINVSNVAFNTSTGTITGMGRNITLDDFLRLIPQATAPATCAIGDIYSDTSGAMCACTASNTWSNMTATGTCT